MTDLQIESLLYSEIIISMADYGIDAWFDRETGEKHIDVIYKKIDLESGFIANGMSIDEVREKLVSVGLAFAK